MDDLRHDWPATHVDEIVEDEIVHDITEEALAEARRYSMLIDWSDEEQIYIVTVPELPGCRTHGATHIEAVEMGEEAIATYLARMRHFDRFVLPPRLFASEAPLSRHKG